jgi:hypothetical protein
VDSDDETVSSDEEGADKHTYAEEFALHVQFFANTLWYEDPEYFPVWVTIEEKLRQRLFNDALFSQAAYTQALLGKISAWEEAKETRKEDTSGVEADGAPSHKRQQTDDQNPAPAKQQRGGRRDDFRGDFRNDAEGTGSGNGGGPPVCIVCTGAHIAREHPTDVVAFKDGAALLCNGNLRTLANFRGAQPRELCAIWNLGRGCQGHPAGGRLHACSLCGGSHPAVSRHADCRRVRAGAFVP